MFTSNQMENILQPTKAVNSTIIPDGNIDLQQKNEQFVIKPELPSQPTTTTSTDLASFGFDFDLSYLETKTNITTPTITIDTTKQNSNSKSLLLNELLSDIYENKPAVKTSPSPPIMNNELILTPQFNILNQQPVQQQQQHQTNGIIKTNIEPNNKLSQKAIDLLDKLPNLNFMKSKVLMFPVNK
jgi:hypothetical protein